MKNDIVAIIRVYKFDIHRVTLNDDNCLTMACAAGANLVLIKYLIEVCKMNINHVNLDNKNCLELACHNTADIMIIKYLTDEGKLKIRNINGNRISFGRFYCIVLTIHEKYCDLNNLLLMGLQKYGTYEMVNLIKRINPLQLDAGIRDWAGIQDPYEWKYNEFAVCVDELARPLEPGVKSF